MKSARTASAGIDVSNLTIPDAEEIIEEALAELSFSQDPGMMRALRFLAPPGYQAIVELCSENGRSKRRNAMVDSWSPEEDEVRIYFERIDGEEPAGARVMRSGRRAIADHAFDDDAAPESPLVADMEARVKELCSALAEAERGGHAFIALKWFRDSFLPQEIVPVEPASGDAAGRTGGGDPAGRGADQQDCESEDAGVSDDDDPAESRRGGDSGGGAAFSSGGCAGGDADGSAGRGTGGTVSCYFLEATAFAKLFVREAGTDALIRLLESIEDNRKLIAASTPLEVYAAIRRRERSGAISKEGAQAALEILRLEAARTVQEPLNPAVLECARQLLDRTTLRWPDALQLGAALVARDMFQGTADYLRFLIEDAAGCGADGGAGDDQSRGRGGEGAGGGSRGRVAGAFSPPIGKNMVFSIPLAGWRTMYTRS